ncbi:MAG TPA: allophanate hydrolase [Bryobacteraceae bacterium]|jgi:allophanate hydrolase
MMQIPDLSIQALRASYNSGSLTPAALINVIYDCIESQPLQPVWISLVPRAEALARAANLNFDLPLFGIPFAIKDNIDFAGLPTTAGCPAFAYAPQQSAFVVNQLEKAGAILIGKTNLDQFATGLVGVRSPHGACSSVFDSRYISGGSSSGSAVAVASGLVTFSLGTDTAGSGRVPAAFNNIVGLKPSRGLLSTSGVVPACRSLDCVSIFALSCGDASAVFQAAKGVDAHDPFTREALPISVAAPAAWRIGVPRFDQLEFFGDKEYKRLYAETLSGLEKDGHALVEIDFPPFSAAAQLLYAGPYVAERFAAIGSFVKNHLASVDPTVGSIVTASERWTAAEAYQALYRLKALTQETAVAWKKIDVLLLPSTPTTYTIEEVLRDPVRLNSNLGYYTNFVNLLDLCGVAIPAGFTSAGLPFGVTAIGPAFAESALLGFGHSIQSSRAPVAGKGLSKIADSPLLASAPRGWIALGVVGAHLSGQPLNYQLVERGAKLLRTTKTAVDYKFYALTNTKPAKPGLIRVPGFEGPGIEIEVWTIHESQFGSFVAAVPPPLAIGTCALANGDSIKGFLCEPYAVGSMPEITHLGSWRSYLKTLK